LALKTNRLFQHTNMYLHKRLQYNLFCFPSIWQHIKALSLHKIAVIAAGICSHLGGPTQKNQCFQTAAEPQRVWNLIPPNIF